MMDPTAASSAAFAALKEICECSTRLFTLQDYVADDSATLLQDDATTLQRSVTNLDSLLRQPTLDRQTKEPLWQAVTDCLLESKEWAATLCWRIKTTIKSPASSNASDNSGEQASQGVSPVEVIRWREECHCHQLMTQLSLQAVIVYVEARLSAHAPENIQLELDKLHQLINKAQRSHLAADATNPCGKKALVEIVFSATEVARNASKHSTAHHLTTTASQRTIRVGDIDSSAPTEAAHQITTATTIGSLMGEPLSEEARKRISSWMNHHPGDRGSILNVPEIPAIYRKMAESESALSPKTRPGDPLLDGENGGISEDDDEEMEVEVAQRYLKEGRARAQAGNHSQAEQFLRRALAQATSLGSRLKGLRTSDILLEIAVSCFEQDKLDEALQTCDQIIRESPDDDDDRRRLLAASHVKSQILLRKGMFDQAARQCKKTLHGRRRLGGKDQAYWEANALLVTIYETKGDEIDAVTYASFLPSDFQRPNFRLPDPAFASSQAPTDAEDSSSIDKMRPRSLSRARTKSNDTLTSFLTNSILRDGDTDSLLSSEPSLSYTTSTRQDSQVSTDPSSVGHEESALALTPAPLKVAARPSPAGLVQSPPKLHALPVQSPRLERPPSLMIQSPGSDEKEMLVLPIQNPDRNQVALQAAPSSPDWAKIPVEPEHEEFSTLEPVHSIPPEPIRRQQTIIMPVSAKVRMTAIRILEQHGIPMSSSRNWSNELFWAASAGHESVVELLLSNWQYSKPSKLSTLRHRIQATSHKAVPVDATDSRMRTALYLAAMNGHTKVVHILLEHGAAAAKRIEVESPQNTFNKAGKRTALEVALIREQRDIVDVFISHGCYDDSPDEDGWTLFHHAAHFGHDSLFIAMLNKYSNKEMGAKTHIGLTPLHIAAQRGRTKLVELMLRRNFDVNARDITNSTPLLLAVLGGHGRCVDLLLDGSSDVHAVDHHEVGVLHLAAREGHKDLLALLRSKGVDIEACDNHMRTPLHYAASNNRLAALQKLLEMGANPHARDCEDNSALHCAAECGHNAIVDALLLGSGLDVNQQNRAGKTALMLAAQGGHRGVVMALLPETANIDLTDFAGATAYKYADTGGHTAVCKLLKLNGATK